MRRSAARPTVAHPGQSVHYDPTLDGPCGSATLVWLPARVVVTHQQPGGVSSEIRYCIESSHAWGVPVQSGRNAYEILAPTQP